MSLPHDVRLAGDNVLKAYNADASKASATGGPEALTASEAALADGKLPVALVYGRKAAEKLNNAEGKAAYGELLLAAGCTAAARAAFEEADKLAEGKSPAAAAGVCIAAWHGGTDAAGVLALAEAAIKAPGTQLAQEARLKFATAKLDDAESKAASVAKRARSGDGKALAMALLSVELDVASYVGAVWPGVGPRAERKSDADAPDGVPLSAWRLQRAQETLAAHLKRNPKDVRALVAAAELSLERRLYAGLLAPPREAGGGGGGGDGDVDEGSAEADEIRGLMQMHGVAEAKMGDASEALRVLQKHRRELLAQAGGDSGRAAEVDELSKLHEWQMRRVDRLRKAREAAGGGAGGAGGAGGGAGGGGGGGAGGAAATVHTAEEELVAHAVASCEAALKNDAARHNPALLLTRGRALLLADRCFCPSLYSSRCFYIPLGAYTPPSCLAGPTRRWRRSTPPPRCSTRSTRPYRPEEGEAPRAMPTPTAAVGVALHRRRA